MDRGAKACPERQARGLPGIPQEGSALEARVRAPRKNREVKRVSEVLRQAVSSLDQFPANPAKDRQFDL
jgi:hypothetical protein